MYCLSAAIQPPPPNGTWVQSDVIGKGPKINKRTTAHHIQHGKCIFLITAKSNCNAEPFEEENKNKRWRYFFHFFHLQSIIDCKWLDFSPVVVVVSSGIISPTTAQSRHWLSCGCWLGDAFHFPSPSSDPVLCLFVAVDTTGWQNVLVSVAKKVPPSPHRLTARTNLCLPIV